MFLLFLLGGLFSQSYTNYSYMLFTKPNQEEAIESAQSISESYAFPLQFKKGKSRSIPFIIYLKDDLCNTNIYRNKSNIWVIEISGE